MRARCLRRFRDIKADTFREEGVVFEVDETRYKEINSAGYGQLVEVVAETPQKPPAKPQKATSEEAKPAPKRRGRPRKTAEPAK